MFNPKFVSPLIRAARRVYESRLLFAKTYERINHVIARSRSLLEQYLRFWGSPYPREKAYTRVHNNTNHHGIVISRDQLFIFIFYHPTKIFLERPYARVKPAVLLCAVRVHKNTRLSFQHAIFIE